ncbi:MAG: hypothetical protein ACM3IJ_03500 [Candidatus Levyibacteriota bacterium]
MQNIRHKILIGIILLIICLRPGLVIYGKKDAYFSRSYYSQFSELKRMYGSSQYSVKNSKVILTDEAVESYLAGAFLQGKDPILFIHDHPPLGKYILSLSILLFDNVSTIIIPIFCVSLLGVYLLSKKVIKHTVLALIPVVIFSNEPLMMVKLMTPPIPELVQLPFILFSFYCFLRFLESKKHKYAWSFSTALFLGATISTRFFITGAVITASFILFLLLVKRMKELFIFAVLLPASLVALFFSYTKTVLDTHSVIKPFSVQKYILTYHESKFIQLFTVWDLLLFNRWHTWWAGNKISFDVNWIPVWPVSVLLSFVLGALAVLKKIKLSDPEYVFLIWVVFYGLTLSTGYTSVRYFLPWLPFFYILAISLLFRAITVLTRVYNSR